MIMIASSDALHDHLSLPSGAAVNCKLLVLDFDSKGSDPSSKDKVNMQLLSLPSMTCPMWQVNYTCRCTEQLVKITVFNLSLPIILTS